MAVEIIKYNSENSEYQVIFTYEPLIAGKHSVYLTGNFNNFAANEIKMQENNGKYSAKITLKQGKYSYKFIIDGFWTNDDDSDTIEADGFGGHNSILYVGNPEEINTLRIKTFSLNSADPNLNVFLVGDFNEWQPNKDKMYYNYEQKAYLIKVPLKVGNYQYKFIVNDIWQQDSSNKKEKSDNLGGYNSLAVIDLNYPKISRDYSEFIHFSLISEDPSFYLNQKSENHFIIRFKTYKDNCESIILHINDKVLALNLIDSNHYFDYYEYSFSSDKKSFRFYFEIKGLNFDYFIYPGLIINKKDTSLAFYYDCNLHKPFLTPDWVKKGIIYQIFVDRFYNGNPEINQDFQEWYYQGKNIKPKKGEYLKDDAEYFHFIKDWYDIKGLKKSPYRNDGKADTNSFYGGDFAGIQKKIPYLLDLGITILYLNPIFEAPSNHKYDAADYMKPDPHFGSSEVFRSLVNEAHTNGIKIIIDVAFNHTGDAFFAFVDSKDKGPKSEYYHWYEWKQWPIPEDNKYNPSDYYNCWWGFGHMPDLDFDRSRLSPYENGVNDINDAEPNWDVINYIYKVIEFWMIDMDIDGFRLDVPNEVPFWFWKLFREKVKSIKPDAYIVGEIWHDAKEWVGENAFDAVMNYAGFKDPVMQFFNLRKCNANDFDKSLKAGLMIYPPQANQVMMNLLDSHDTFRYLEIASGDVIKLKLSIVFQMTYVGTPHIWYGDEVAMQGSHDPDCRRPFNWKYKNDPQKIELREFYKKLIKIRKENPALSSENFKTVNMENNLYIYKRWNQIQEIFIVINNSNESCNIELTLDNCDNYSDLLSNNIYENTKGKFAAEISPFTALILRKSQT